MTPCEKTPNSCACSTFASANYEKCSPDSCTNNPNQKKCCVGNEIWEGGKCIDYCATAPNSCKCKTYASSHYEECAEDSCTNNPNQQKCCTSSQEWSGGKCVDLCSLYAGTCKCPTYAESHYEQCDANSCTNNPNQEKCCDVTKEKWDGSKCVALTACEINPNACTCQTYYDSHIEECDANSCTNRPNQAKCCNPATEIWNGEEGQCVPKPPCPGEKPEAETTDCRFGCGTQVVEYECSATAKEWIPVYGECTTKSGYSEECAPGATRSQGCNNVGTQIKTCTEKCAWGEWETCDCGTPTNDGKQSYSEACPYGYSGSVDYTWNAKTCTYDVNNTCVQDPCPHEEEPSPTTQDCNYGCGTQSVTWQCNEAKRKWEPVYGECGAKSGYKLECAPGATTSQVCNGVGTQGRECSNKCTWGAWETCDCGTPTNGGKKSYTESCAYGHSGIKTYTWNTTTCKYDLKDTCVKDDCPHEERPADTTEACGNCGTRSVTYSCNVATGQWKANYGTCSGEGVCAPGAISTSYNCSGNGSKSRTCSSSCTWGSYGDCKCGTAPYGSSYTESCPSGYTGKYSYSWNNSICDYDRSGSCAQCDCTPGVTQQQTCKTYGTQTRTCKSDGTCSWGSWSACSCPASSAPNGASYTASCPADHTGSITYTWNTSTCSYDVKNTCVAEACPSSQRPKDYTESCGNCGTRSVTYYCNASAKQWTASYGTCNGQGTCSPGATSTSTSGCSGSAYKTRTCNSSCQWGNYGSCVCPSSGSCSNKSCASGTFGSYPCSWNSNPSVCGCECTNNCDSCPCSGSETETSYTGPGSAYKTRTCNGCQWGSWSGLKCPSTGSKGASYEVSCGSGYSGKRVYKWNSSTSVCDYQLSTDTCSQCACSGNTTQRESTGAGSAYRTRTCDGCNWGDWKYICDPATPSSYTESCPSGYSGSGYKYTWNSSTSVCAYQLTSSDCSSCACSGSTTQKENTGVGSAYRTRTCDGCNWSGWTTKCDSRSGYTESCPSGYSGSGYNYTWNNSTSVCAYQLNSSDCSKNCSDSSKPSTSRSCGCLGQGTQTRSVTCNNGSWTTGSWGSCSIAEDCTCSEPKPSTSRTCGCKNGGTQSRTVTCSTTTGLWSTGAWGACSISNECECDPNSMLNSTAKCGCKNKGTKSRTVTCNTSTGLWSYGSWGACSIADACECDESLKPSSSTTCGCMWKGTKTRTVSCNTTTGSWSYSAWGECSIPPDCECSESSKPAESRSCGCKNGGTQNRTVTCNTKTGLWSTGSWSTCTIADECTCPPPQPATSQSCGCKNGGTQTRAVTCNTSTGTWTTGSWGTCSISSICPCDDGSKPATSQACGCKNGGTQTRDVTCNTSTGTWTTGSWGSCSIAEDCTCPQPQPATSQSCGCKNGGTQNRTVTCNTSTGNWTIGSWGSCSIGMCTCDKFKPVNVALCGCSKKGQQTRDIICNTSTGEWVPGPWGTCSMPAGYGSACTAGETETRTCTTNSNHSQKRTCTAYCNWGSWGSCSCTAQPTRGTSYTESCPTGQTGKKTYTWNTNTCKYTLTSNTCKAKTYYWTLRDCTSAHCCSYCGTSTVDSQCSGTCSASQVGTSRTVSGPLYPGESCPDKETCTCVCE
ncbi:MAG: hypothetical protein IKC13_04945 [Elusimicrobiaceae bacterium]|nr:hypothetical protein [Elusimicrobiaceae bacterium]